MTLRRCPTPGRSRPRSCCVPDVSAVSCQVLQILRWPLEASRVQNRRRRLSISRLPLWFERLFLDIGQLQLLAIRRAGRIVATTGHFFEDMMATRNYLDIAGRVAGKSSCSQRAFRRLQKRYGVELHQDDLSIVLMTIRSADKLWHPQFSGAITFVSQRLTVVFWFVEARNMSSWPFGFQDKLWSGVTESIASSSLHYAFSGVRSPAPPLHCRSGLFHLRAASPHRPVRASPSSRNSSRSLHLLRASPCPGAAAGHCLWPSLRQEEPRLRFGNDYMYSGTGATTTSSRSPFPGSSEVVRTIFESHRIRECVQQSGAPTREGQVSKGEWAPCAARQGYSWLFPPSETLWCALVCFPQAPVWLCFRPWLFW